MWHRLAASALIRPLAWEPPYATGAALKRQNNYKKKKKKERKKKKRKKGTGLLGREKTRPVHSTIFKFLSIFSIFKSDFFSLVLEISLPFFFFFSLSVVNSPCYCSCFWLSCLALVSFLPPCWPSFLSISLQTQPSLFSSFVISPSRSWDSQARSL